MDGGKYDVAVVVMCLMPLKNTLPFDVTPLLILDSFCIHMMGPIIEKLQGLGIEFQHQVTDFIFGFGEKNGTLNNVLLLLELFWNSGWYTGIYQSRCDILLPCWGE